MAQAPTITVKVELPDLTKRLISTLQAVMGIPEKWERDFTITVGQLIDTMSDSLLPDGEHNEEVCSTGVINCPECVASR